MRQKVHMAVVHSMVNSSNSVCGQMLCFRIFKEIDIQDPGRVVLGYTTDATYNGQPHTAAIQPYKITSQEAQVKPDHRTCIVTQYKHVNDNL